MGVNVFANLDAVLPPEERPPSEHPDTGETATSVDFESKPQNQEITWSRPRAPGRTACDGYDDDGYPINERDLTDAEYETAYARYEKADAEWLRTNGRALSRGPILETCILHFASGSSASYRRYRGQAWDLVAVTHTGRALRANRGTEGGA